MLRLERRTKSRGPLALPRLRASGVGGKGREQSDSGINLSVHVRVVLVQNHHGLRGLKHLEFIVSQFWRREV